MKRYEEGDVVLCTVTKIVGTVVFVKIEDDGEGSIITSEIAPGRIRNLRDYVVPNKKIVCKIIRISGDRIDLSLRRVSGKERDEVKTKYKKEKECESIIKSVLKDKTPEIIKKIKENYQLYEFLQKVKETPKLIEKICSAEESKKIIKILNEKKEKSSIVKKTFKISSKDKDGIKIIKRILTLEDDKIKIKYLGSNKFSIELEDENPKKANQRLSEIIEDIEEKAKKERCEFEIKGK